MNENVCFFEVCFDEIVGFFELGKYGGIVLITNVNSVKLLDIAPNQFISNFIGLEGPLVHTSHYAVNFSMFYHLGFVEHAHAAEIEISSYLIA